jgi:hypothetical protein
MLTSQARNITHSSTQTVIIVVPPTILRYQQCTRVA